MKINKGGCFAKTSKNLLPALRPSYFGHGDWDEACVIFDSCVEDKQILALAEHLSKSKRITAAKGMGLINHFGNFNKWIRGDDEGLAIN